MNYTLEQFLNFSPQQVENSKITLSVKTNDFDPLSIWLTENGNADFSYHSHYSSRPQAEQKKAPARNFSVDSTVLGFVNIGVNRWLFITAGVVTEVPEISKEFPNGTTCKYEIIDKFSPLFGKLIINLEKGNKFSRYAFNLNTFISQATIEQILPVNYGVRPFPGYANVNISFNDLLVQIEDLEWKSPLSAVSGIYLLTDTQTNKKYVGSAYGTNGIYGRWRNYLDRGYDKEEEQSGTNFPNSQLRQIATNPNLGLIYIKNYFKFTILETIPNNTAKNDVIKRENYWKEVLNTRSRDFGYNSN